MRTAGHDGRTQVDEKNRPTQTWRGTDEKTQFVTLSAILAARSDPRLTICPGGAQVKPLVQGGVVASKKKVGQYLPLVPASLR